MEPSPKSPEGKQRRHSHAMVEERESSTTLGRIRGVLLLSEEGTGQRTASWPPQHHPITSSCPVRHYPDIPLPELPVESPSRITVQRCSKEMWEGGRIRKAWPFHGAERSLTRFLDWCCGHNFDEWISRSTFRKFAKEWCVFQSHRRHCLL